MLKRTFALAFSTAFAVVTIVTVPVHRAHAEMAAPTQDSTKAEVKKQLTPQQQKMKDCAAKWQEEKAKTGAKGRAAYRKFMSDCLKKAPA